MDVTKWYTVALGCFVALFFSSYHLLRIARISHTYPAFRFFKHLYYPLVHRYLRGSSKTTRFDAALIFILLAGNTACLIVGWKDVATLVGRLGVMSTINLVPLTLGEHMNFVANCCGVSLGAYSRMHEWIGLVAILEGLIHAVAAVLSQPFNPHTRFGIEALVTVAVLGTILLSSMAFVRRRAYEIFQKLHLFLAAMLITAIYLHSPSKQLFTSPVVYLFAAVCLQICTAFFRISQVLYRNIRYGKPPSRATVRTITYKTRERDIPISDAVQVHIRPLQPWKPRAGQYVYLSIRGVSHTSLMQSHPFSVAWWYRDTEGDAIVLIVEKRKGFTEDLFSHTSTDIGPQSGMQATVEGPYGKELDLESYGTVLLFATGMGIAAQLPYVTRLLEGYHNRKLKSRRIALFWELESELHAAWVADMMMELLRRDTDEILDIKLFVLGSYLSSETNEGDFVPLGKRISMTYNAMDAEALIGSEIAGRKGDTVVSLCTDLKTSEKIRDIVRKMLDRTIHLKELEYNPPSLRGSKARLRGMV